MGKNDRRCIDGKGLFDDLAGVDGRSVYRASEQLVKSEDPVPVVEEQAAEQFVLEMPHASLQKGFRVTGGANRLPAGQRFSVIAPGEFGQRTQDCKPGVPDAIAIQNSCRIGVQQRAQASETMQEPRGGVFSGRITTTGTNHCCEQLNVALLFAGLLRHDRMVIDHGISIQRNNLVGIAGFGRNAQHGQAKLDHQTADESVTVNIVLGITGGIAAYKAPDLVRRLRERGADVQIVMTASAEEFVTETALQAVSGRPIRSNLWDKEAEAAMSHIELARWADVVLVAPATAEVMARIVSGAAPDLLTTLCLATEAPIALAPAMNHVMWNNPATQANRELLEQRGIHILGPDTGSQACGETGAGRMLDPETIAATVCGLSAGKGKGSLEGRTVIVTAGPTREPIDPVRYITNRSSGKMGYAIARAAAAQGAAVILISGPVNLPPPPGMRVVSVQTAQEMFDATHEHVTSADIFIAAAAVADYRPASAETQKIKKRNETIDMALVRCPDILASVAALEIPPFTVGFAAETEKVEDYARSKLENKKLNMIVANKVGDNSGFDQDDNAVSVLWKSGKQEFPRTAKADLARHLVDLITEHFYAARGSDTEPRLTVISSLD